MFFHAKVPYTRVVRRADIQEVYLHTEPSAGSGGS